MTTDLIDTYLHIAPGSTLDHVRALRAEARENIQASFDSLFVNGENNGFSYRDRYAIGYFIARLQDSSDLAGTFADYITKDHPNLLAVIDYEVHAGRATGPFGRYKEPQLQNENTNGVAYSASTSLENEYGSFLARGLEHAHLLLFRPREASPEALQDLTGGGWERGQIITLSQLVAFLSFFVRVIAGLTVLQSSIKQDAPK